MLFSISYSNSKNIRVYDDTKSSTDSESSKNDSEKENHPKVSQRKLQKKSRQAGKKFENKTGAEKKAKETIVNSKDVVSNDSSDEGNESDGIMLEKPKKPRYEN